MAQNSSKLWEKAMVFGFKIGCHQKSNRSFFLKGHQFPVCARCTGVFLGQILALININYFREHLYLPLALLALGIMGADWLAQKFDILMSTNFRRLLTGILGGYGIVASVFLLLKMLFG